ncbi:nuclear pore complex protein DDB_G0274915 isoform X4 [Scaptodrosophila lebanonensis]|uniref:Nuclear pore complex protein DDB_G0274915 isoform X4 n=1 Tax=Drosophila lebanonensis TaxID=7225 RepID=A0A6J2TJX0_DROLE|nr:nuclear pore complex protein DDB_G0274915 isoform X4 [Scaptodrosophila lebanonensis]
MLPITVTLLLLTLTPTLIASAPAPAPDKLDANNSPFALELQPPLLDNPTGGTAIDSYGNPIDTLKPIDTPDGRKVVSAQGLQFEIPNYASGITEIRKPADDLLPPHIDPLSKQQPPKPFERATTTTTAAPIAERNPFDSATIPPWLVDFDYPDVGPGVPYNPDNFKDTGSSTVHHQSGGTKPNDFKPHGFTHQTTTNANFATATATAGVTISQSNSPPTSFAGQTVTTSSAFPSKVTLPLPSIDSDTVEPPLVLIPPAEQVDDSATDDVAANHVHGGQHNKHIALATHTSTHFPTSTNSVTHFAAHLEPQGSSTQPPLPVLDEQFPPFQQSPSLPAGDAANKKIEYTKSEEGKVITTPVTNGLGAQRKDAESNNVFTGFGSSSTTRVNTVGGAAIPQSTPSTSNTGKYTGSFGAPAGLLKPLGSVSSTATVPAAKPNIYVAGDEHEFSHNVRGNKARPTANPGRYTGGFGAPSGVLSPQGGEPRPFQQPQQSRQHNLVAAASSTTSSSSYQSRFGGPPGILVPFDNVQRPAQQ